MKVYDIEYEFYGRMMYGKMQPTRHPEDTWVEWFADKGCNDFIEDQEAIAAADEATENELFQLWHEWNMEEGYYGYEYY